MGTDYGFSFTSWAYFPLFAVLAVIIGMLFRRTTRRALIAPLTIAAVCIVPMVLLILGVGFSAGHELAMVVLTFIAPSILLVAIVAGLFGSSRARARQNSRQQ